MNRNIENWTIAGHNVEYFEDEHIYLVDGVITPSITEIMKIKFGNKYNGINTTTLQKAAEYGTSVHSSIENFEVYNINNENVIELKNWKFLKKAYKFKCIGNEIPVILFIDNKPFACGRIDLKLEENGKLNEKGLGDIKATSTLDREYLGYQLNLYRIAYEQSYGEKINFLRGIHLKKDVRKYIEIPINEEIVLDLINEYRKKGKNE